MTNTIFIQKVTELRLKRIEWVREDGTVYYSIRMEGKEDDSGDVSVEFFSDKYLNISEAQETISCQNS